MAEKEIIKLLVITMLVWVFLAFVSKCNAATVKHQGNSIGIPMYQTNPYFYMAGSVSQVFDVRDGKGIVVRIQPLATYSLFTEDLLFCDKPTEMFENKSNPIVLTYEIATRRAIEGVGCHRLISVRELKPNAFKP